MKCATSLTAGQPKHFPARCSPAPGCWSTAGRARISNRAISDGRDGEGGKQSGDANRRRFRLADSAVAQESYLESSLPKAPSPPSVISSQFPAVVRFDLKPEADGSLKLPLADFDGQPVHRNHRHGCLRGRHPHPAAARQRHTACATGASPGRWIRRRISSPPAAPPCLQKERRPRLKTCWMPIGGRSRLYRKRRNSSTA